MNQWYRKKLTKVIVLITGILCGAVVLTTFITAADLAGTVNPSDVIRLSHSTYEDSKSFEQDVNDSVAQVFEQYRIRNLFETDGAYNPDKIIDIMELVPNGQADGKNVSGVAYTLEQLENWGKDFVTMDDAGNYGNQVIVCQRNDGSYYYYYLKDFLDQCSRGDLTIEFSDAYQSQAEFLKELSEDSDYMYGDYDLTIYDKDGNALYTDCWNFGSSIKEEYAPQGAENLLQLVNATPELNGMLNTIYDNLKDTLNTIYNDSRTYWSGWDNLKEGNTNFSYIYIDENAKQLYTNRSEYKDYAKSEENIRRMTQLPSSKYMIVYPKLEDFDTNMDISYYTQWTTVRDSEMDQESDNIFAAAVDTSYPVHDLFYEGKQKFDTEIPLLRMCLILFTVCSLLFVVCIVWLALTAGRIPGDERLYLTAFDNWKTELSAGIIILVWIMATFVMLGSMFTLSDIGYSISSGMADMGILFFYGLFTSFCFFIGFISLVKRIKGGLLWKKSLLYAILRFCGEVLQERSVTFREGLLLFGFFCISWAAFLIRNLPMAVIMLLADAGAAWLVLGDAIARHRIRKGIEEIASGNLEYQINLNGLRKTNRNMAEKINSIGSGLNHAVDKAMKNERLKTDLITNVSHDIKTPLTSIINYVDILKHSDISDTTIRGYLDILEEKAQRLKTLTEDVVEASKVSSGNISLEYMDVDLGELVQQTEGELEEKFTARDLTVVTKLPDNPAIIYVDGRRMWRVLENVFGNAAKYAMPGTRVYADLTVTDGRVLFSLKNISEQQLNISADELTERFIRGDLSRSTEGSGLGLSIAKSLTEMMGGKFLLYLDGDLFRVNIEFSGKQNMQQIEEKSE